MGLVQSASALAQQLYQQFQQKTAPAVAANQANNAYSAHQTVGLVNRVAPIVQQAIPKIPQMALNTANTVGRTIGQTPISSVPFVNVPKLNFQQVAQKIGGPNTVLSQAFTGNVQKIPGQIATDYTNFGKSLQQPTYAGKNATPQQQQQARQNFGSLVGANLAPEGINFGPGLKGLSPRAFNIHPQDQEIMHDFVNAVQTGAAKANLGQLGKDAQVIADHYIGKSVSNISNQKLAQVFDAILSRSAKLNGEDVVPTNLPKGIFPTNMQDAQKGFINFDAKLGRQSPPTAPAATQKYLDELATKQKIAGESGTPGVFNKVKGVYQNIKAAMVDSASPIEDALSNAEKKGNFQVRPTGDIRLQIDRVLRSKSLGSQFAEDNGLVSAIKSAPDLHALDQYMIAKQAARVGELGMKTGRDAGKDAQLVKDLAPQYEPIAKQVNQYSQKLLDYSVQSGLIDKGLADQLKTKYPDYVPLNRIFNELETNGYQGASKSIANLSRQTVVQKLQGSEREIQSPIESLLLKTQTAFQQGEKNIAARQLASYKDLPGMEGLIKPIRTAENVNKRIDLYTQAKELKPVQNITQRLIATRNKWSRDLGSEINKLNQKGLFMSLKDTGETVVPKQTARMWTKTVGQQIKINSPQSLDQLKNSYQVKDILSKEYGFGKTGIRQLSADVFNGGTKQLAALNPKLDSSTVKSIVNQIFKDPTIIPETVNRKILGVEPTAQETKALVNNIANLPSSEIEQLKKMIGNREGKLTNVLNTLSQLNQRLGEVKTQRGSLFDEARALRDAESRGKSTFSTLNNGVREVYETTPEIASAAKNLNAQQMNIVTKMLNVPTRMLQLGATSLNIPFAATNLLKDQIDAAVNGKYGARTLANPNNFIQGLFAAVGHGDLYKQVIRDAGMSTSFDISREAPNLAVDQIRAGRNVGSNIAYTVTHPQQLLRAFENVIGRTEELTRVQQYQGAYKGFTAAGRTPEDARLLAAQAARNNTANFARHGDLGKVINYVIPFFNANIQGARTFVNAMKDRPVQTSAKLAVGLFTPMAATTLWNTTDPQRKQIYDDIQESDKEKNIIIIPDGATKDASGKWNVIKIPLPTGLSPLVNLVRRGIEQTQGGNPVQAKEVLDAMVGAGTPFDTSSPTKLVGGFTPQAVKPFVEGVTNTNLYTGNKIVPDSMKNLPPDQQVKPNTSPLAKTIGGLTGQSPLTIENGMNTALGGVGGQILGKNPLQQLQGRFTQASGNAQVDKQFQDINKYQQDQAVTSQAQKTNVKNITDILLNKDTPVQQKQALLQKLGQPANQSMFTLVKQELRDRTYNVSAADRAVRGLSITERAKYTIDHVKALQTKEEKIAFIQGLSKKGILTKSVVTEMKKQLTISTK